MRARLAKLVAAYLVAFASVAVAGWSATPVSQALDLARAYAAGTAELDADLAHSDAYGAVMAGCMHTLGYADVAADGAGLTYTEPVGKDGERFRNAMARCALDNDYTDPPTPLSTAAYGVLYDRYLSNWECLTEHGFDPSQPGDRQSFINSQGEAWHPWRTLLPGDHAFMAVCPSPEREPDR